MALAAHPDDIEFLMAGTLLLLKGCGFETHYMTLSNGNCGSMQWPAEKTRRIRRQESIAAAKILGAHYHPSLADDLEIVYEVKLLRRLAAVIRDVRPNILLIPSPQDYMEDHTNTCRLAVTAAFTRGMPNFRTTPARKANSEEVILYHGMPHGLRDGLRQRIIPELFVNTESVHELKRQALAAHASQKEWLDATQGIDSYLQMMDEMSLELGRMSGRFKHAEGWRRHSHFGFSPRDDDPLSRVFGNLSVKKRERE
ncbi:MAG TPA: PIG-L deacetylase family protein [Verrucomicrobiae bacterium]|nr:PIG-L deacetylase family protein [Verrucomicrobiae bacterium]